MSIKVKYNDGVFTPLEEVKGARQGRRYTAFSGEQLDGMREMLAWLKTTEKSFEFWNNAADALYDERSRDATGHAA